MKVQLNCITNYGGASLKPGDVIDIPLNVSQRWINRGIAHECKEVVVIPETVKKIVEAKIIETKQEFEPLPEVTEENKNEIKTYTPKKVKSKKK